MTLRQLRLGQSQKVEAAAGVQGHPKKIQLQTQQLRQVKLMLRLQHLLQALLVNLVDSICNRCLKKPVQQ